MAIALTVDDVCIEYKILNNTSVQKSLFKKKQHTEIFEAVKHVSFEVEEGGILGIIGKNGSGKSTLLKSIAGVFSPNNGKIDLHDNTVSLMALGVGFKHRLTGRENIVLSGMMLGFSEDEIRSKIDEIIEFAELGDFIDKPVRTYSSGMHSKLAFSITAMLETNIMLVDEVLSVGDERFRKKSLAKMKSLIANRDRTVVIVSHSIETLREFCDKILWIHDGETIECGETNTVLEHYLEYMETEKSVILGKRKAESELLRAKEEMRKKTELDDTMSDEDIIGRIVDIRDWYNCQIEAVSKIADSNLRMRELFRIMDIFVSEYAGFTRKSDAAFYKFVDSFCKNISYLNKIDAVSVYQDKEEKFLDYHPIDYMLDGQTYSIDDMLSRLEERKIRNLIDKKALESYTIKAKLYQYKNRIKSQANIPGGILAYELVAASNSANNSEPYYVEYRIKKRGIVESDDSNSELTVVEEIVTRRRLFFPLPFVSELVKESVDNYLNYCEKELICPFKKIQMVYTRE